MQTLPQKTCAPVATAQRPKTFCAVPHACLKSASPILPVPSRRSNNSHVAAAAATSLDGEVTDLLQGQYELAYFARRTRYVRQHFPDSLGIDDFLHRLETALFAFGFNGENTIACTDLCRDEITAPLHDKIDLIFGQNFNINGLGGVLTCGSIGLGAGLSHSPVDQDTGKERYLFFALPHIAVSPYHDIGGLSRAGRPGKSSACGALCAALAELQGKGLAGCTAEAGVHDPVNPEYTILRQRLAARLQQDGATDSDIKGLDLVGLTKVAERTIAADLESLIKAAVDPSKADYAVVTGVQIHSWGKEFDDGSPNLEYVQPVSVYAVVDGQKTDIDLRAIPALTPRQAREVASARASYHGTGEVADKKLASEGTAAKFANFDSFYPSSTRRAASERASHFRELLGNMQRSNNGA